ncbi:hypothetical protein DR999_PMT18377 [Platysternon megacephalum]|uniref:Uncharacterized protein n=1 Tax=Platysternon megacephalum TaxID=55544 RepID=A0A4D9DRL9_9SAUR|nr:hypothetical protein DR999_PMT18377 [Platysternon megacephalum]
MCWLRTATESPERSSSAAWLQAPSPPQKKPPGACVEKLDFTTPLPLLEQGRKTGWGCCFRATVNRHGPVNKAFITVCCLQSCCRGWRRSSAPPSPRAEHHPQPVWGGGVQAGSFPSCTLQRLGQEWEAGYSIPQVPLTVAKLARLLA